jgi:plasmid stabilization system protein ParE
MNRRLTLRSQAELEIGEAAVWYEGCGAGLGNDFLRAVDAALAAIQRNPFQYQIISGELRRAGLRRFPYSPIYRCRDQEIIVVACAHGRRDPRRWMERE